MPRLRFGFTLSRPKFDGVIEAVRYTKDGRISLARLYERRGAVWTDSLALDRKALAARLERGRRFVTGRRKMYCGATFETGSRVRLDGEAIRTDGAPAGRDSLTGVPVF
ncbi:MAG: hypothetical protein FD146_2223 [Anaerolineaceae bacterium]|nr:MAG: hypothetical protein FD146_2223 [Anaerolineaceae bacterium]